MKALEAERLRTEICWLYDRILGMHSEILGLKARFEDYKIEIELISQDANEKINKK